MYFRFCHVFLLLIKWWRVITKAASLRRPAHANAPTGSTQPCIPPGSLNRVPALISWGKGGNVTSAGWQVTLCDPIWHVSSRSSEALCELLYILPFTFTFYCHIGCVLFAKTRRVLYARGRVSDTPLPLLQRWLYHKCTAVVLLSVW